MAQPVLSPRGEDFTMKDLIFVGATIAFFALAWVYAKATDGL
jgi:hypothetical protein